jgi:dephospho-CoA kinase
MNRTLKFGIAGRMRTGKTTIAQYLKERYGFHTCAFADPIKAVAKECGWDGAKDERGRTLLQDIGTVVRKYNQTFWIEKLIAELPPNRSIVVDDMRMLKEHTMLSDAGFTTILVTRDPSLIHDAAGTTDHITEREVDLITPWRTIENNGSFEDLYAQIDEVVAELDRNAA